MTHDVIMPALGMAQTSGVIVNWLKSPGDAVAEGDPLMEVETDKAVMEVTALASGYLVEVLFPAGSDVPVGEVIGRIGESADLVAAAPAVEKAAEENPQPAPEPASKPTAAPTEKTAAAPAEKPALPAPRDGRVLSSPKARRLAAERGIDLRRLLVQGVAEPVRAADLDSYRPAATGATQSEITARIDGAELARIAAWAEAEAGITPSALWAGLAASVLGRDGVIRVGVQDFAVNGRPALGDLAGEDAGQALPDLILRDLRDSRISHARLAGDQAPVLTIIGRDELTITLGFTADQLDPQDAFDLIDAFAARVEDPLRLLL